MKKFLVVIERKPTFTGKTLQGHREFLQELRNCELLVKAGGFEDQSGGAYILQTSSLEEARNIVDKDPMNQENESVYKVKEWNVM
ncbi:YciI family protein [Priestia aryabhattai]|uniref:YciI family protein n=1 Tax=Priestia megaterium TaxID=1404 RepID=UPI0039B88548